MMQKKIKDNLTRLLSIASPTGYTDEIIQSVKSTLEDLGYKTRISNRGALTCQIGNGVAQTAIVVHLDTLGAMLSQIEDNGTLRLAPLGSWSSRFAEGARVTLITDNKNYRGTILPQKSSGHVYSDGIDKQPVSWSNLRLRLDERIHSKSDVEALGIRIGDTVCVDSVAEFSENGFINSRHLDDKAAVAVILSVLSEINQSSFMPCEIIFTVSEEIGTGAQHLISDNIKQCLAIDISTADISQNTCEGGITFAYMDSSGPYDRKLTRELEALCDQHHIAYTRDVFRHYRSDASAVVEAGYDIRCALVCFEVDSSHGYERTHIDSLLALASLIKVYLQDT